MSIHKRHLSTRAGVLVPCNPRRSAATLAVTKSLRPWPRPKSTIPGRTLTMPGSIVAIALRTGMVVGIQRNAEREPTPLQKTDDPFLEVHPIEFDPLFQFTFD